MRYAAALMLAAGLVLSGCTSSSPDASRAASPGGAPVGGTVGTPSPTAQKPVPPDPGVCPVSELKQNRVGYSPSATHLWQDPKDVRAAFLCRVTARRVAGDGIWLYLVVDRVTSPVDKLLLAYAQPDEIRDPDDGGTLACTTEYQVSQVLWLQTEDGAAAVRAPVDTCGKPLDPPEHDYPLMKTIPVRVTKVERIRTQLSLDTDCNDTWDAREIGRLDHLPPTLAPHPARPGARTRVCEFEIPKNRPWKKGDLRSGYRLTAKEAAGVRATLRRAPADRTCAAGTPRRFVVIHGWDREVAVSPDGCVWQSNGVWRADPALFERLVS